ncbi:MAG: serine/threonine protein kinase [Myxococcales bacterium]|nr:serine/threonine protein kinase [Myxococcales bacterium]
MGEHLRAFLRSLVPAVPASYFSERTASHAQRAWVMLLYVVFVYGAFYGLDVVVYPRHALVFGVLRMVGVAAALAGLLLGRRSARARSILAVASYAWATFSVSTMTVLTEGFGSNYLVGVVLCFAAGSTIELLSPLGFFTLGLSVVVYHLSANAIFDHHIARGEIAWASFMLSGALLLCSVAAVLIDEQRRRLFLAKFDLDAKNRELESKHRELRDSYRQADRIFAALAEALQGTTLDDKYRLDEQIGQGGFGAVYRSTDLASGASVAVKVFRPQVGNESLLALKRFQQEGASAKRVNHHNAINVFGSGVSSDGIAYIVMELLEGHSLAVELREKGRLPVSRSCHIARSIALALAAAHRAGIVHRDVKPENVFLHRAGEDEVVKVLDFGAAKRHEGEDAQTATMTGMIGTPIYMAPERFESGECDGRADVYSVGILFYQMLTGRLPFTAKEGEIWSLVSKHRHAPPPPLNVEGDAVPPRVAALCLRALAKQPQDRPSAEELAREITAMEESPAET